MKKSLMLYLFLLAILMNIFTYMFYSREVKFEKERYDKTTKRLRDSINLVSGKLAEADYFSLEHNENAQNYFDNTASGGKVILYEKLIPAVTEKLLDLNENPNGNPYTGQDIIDGKKFIINKIKVLNHRWIIADYSNGELWGEVLLKYFVDDKENITFEVNQSWLYQK
ncbi:hypothetical protein AAEO57_16775 [Flavobacterium sp. DGU38]|uniref:Hydrolase n=1 Tax=Flavobacterium calami TaxID=3139144 RepID=A0ABU9ISM3_9FLAO